MSAEPAPGRDIGSDHFERNPSIEDSVTKSYEDKAYAFAPLLSMADYHGGPGKEQTRPKWRKPKSDAHSPHRGSEDRGDDASCEKTCQP